jgi:hypothetical protein
LRWAVVTLPMCDTACVYHTCTQCRSRAATMSMVLHMSDGTPEQAESNRLAQQVAPFLKIPFPHTPCHIDYICSKVV